MDPGIGQGGKIERPATRHDPRCAGLSKLVEKRDRARFNTAVVDDDNVPLAGELRFSQAFEADFEQVRTVAGWHDDADRCGALHRRWSGEPARFGGTVSEDQGEVRRGYRRMPGGVVQELRPAQGFACAG